MRKVFRSMQEPLTARPVFAGNSATRRSLLTWMRSRKLWFRSIAALVAVALLNLCLQPLAVAAALHPVEHDKRQASNEEKLSSNIQTIQERLESLEAKLNRRQDASQERSDLQTLRSELNALDEQALRDFDDVERQLKERNLSGFLERHYQAVAAYKQEMRLLKTNLESVEGAVDDNDRRLRAGNAKEHLKASQIRSAHMPFDPNNLPFRIRDGKARKPHQTPAEYQSRLFKQEPIRLASAEVSSAMLLADAVALAASAAAPSAADLAPSEDVVLTDDVRALATSLGGNPARIYHWVHNNISFAPTYGSIQGAQMCLETRQCNAFDTASLLIALLRASNVPARYTYGTVQVPIDKVMNWVGGVTTPEAAMDLLGQGGIPNLGVIQAGRIAAVRFEHVWVEAYVDFHPSRGVVHRQGDGWLPMDASFKQYQYTRGLDLKTNVAFDGHELVGQVAAAAQINVAEGWIAGVDQNRVRTALINYQTQAKAYVDSVRPNATAQDVLGGKTIVATDGVLAASLPYRLVALGSKFAVIPANLRYTITISLFASELDRALDSPALTYTASLAALSGKRLGVTYQPATTADAQLIQSYVAQGATSLPAYLVQTRPVLQLEGIEQAAGGAVAMGQTQLWDVLLSDPQGAFTTRDSYTVKSGDEIVFGINSGGISQAFVQHRIATTPSNTAAENLNQVALHYWMQYDLYDSFVSSAMQVVRYRLPSMGNFSSPLNVRYFFGIARSANYEVRTMDVKRVMQSAVRNDAGSVLDYSYASGAHGSNLEGVVFEQLFGRPSGAGISAMQLLRDASAAGVRIYRITSDNVSAVLPVLALTADVKADIANAVAVGMEVVAPQTEVVHPHGHWQGTGYLMLDPATGAGAYLINGGLNGGSDAACGDEQPSPVPLVSIIVAIVLIAILIALLIAAWPTITAGAAAFGGSLVTAFRALVLASGLLVPAVAEASFNRNAACLNAVDTATSAFAILEQRIAEYLAAPVRDAPHYATIQDFATRLENAIETIKRCCRVLPPDLETWEAAVVQARTLPPP